MSQFQLRHINRISFPNKFILVVEDDIQNQLHFVKWAHQRFPHQGEVQLGFVPGAIAAASVINNHKPNLIILDHDLPHGNGTDLLIWMNEMSVSIPIITASGIAQNNDNMESLCKKFGIEVYKFEKSDVYMGYADSFVEEILNRNKS